MWIFLLLLLLATMLLPSFWVRRQLNSGQEIIADLPGSGGELAQHLIEINKLENVQLEICEGDNDHYDPSTKTVRLSEKNTQNQSLTAIAVAAHEVGHAIQHQQNYAPLLLRGKLVHFAYYSDKIASILIMASPIILAISKNPRVFLLMAGAGIAAALIQTVVHFITLPVEFDASFGRALPLLEKTELSAAELKTCRRILLACALTYVSQSIMGLFRLQRWISILRR